MTRCLLLDDGRELTPESCRAAVRGRATLRLRLLDPAPPFRALDTVRVSSGPGADGGPRDLLLYRVGHDFGIRFRDGASADATEEIVGRIVAVERGQAILSLQSGSLARCPRRWLPRALDAREILARMRHPLTPPLFLGNEAECLASVHDKYNGEVEVAQYTARMAAGLEPHEREIVERYVKAGGQLLDVGCGAGREAIVFARMGFRVVGIDIAPRMIEAARANAERAGLAIDFRSQSVTELNEPPGSFDGVFLAGAYHHIPGRELRVGTLRRIARALTGDGVLILLAHYGGARGLLSRSRLVDLIRRTGRMLRSRRRLSEPGDRHMRQVSEASDAGQPCFFHDFSGPAEVGAEVAAAGFTPEEVMPGWWVCRVTRSLPVPPRQDQVAHR